MDLISVIIPMYNAEPYIERCLRSIQRQTYRNLEIIVIDDGSEDNGAEICRRIGGHDGRIRLICQGNSGVSAARNAGLKEVSGRFVVFADADDYVEPDYISTLYEQIEKTGADVAVCGYDRGEVRQNAEFYEMVLSSRSAIINMLLSIDFDSAICCKMCPSGLAKETGFRTEYCLGEDLMFYFSLFRRCRKVSYVNRRCYHYIQHADSAMHAPPGRAVVESLRVFEELLCQCEDKIMEDAVIAKYVSTCFHLLSLSREKLGKKEIAGMEQVVKKYRSRIIRSRIAGRKVKTACLVSCLSFGLVNRLLELTRS